MGSWFDSKVYERRKRSPWMTPSLLGFAKDVLLSYWPDKQEDERPVVLTIANRPDVASRFWYTLEWTAEDGSHRAVSSQEYDLLMWRAAVTEQDVREERAAKEGVFVVSGLGRRGDDDDMLEYSKRIKAHAAAVDRSLNEKATYFEVWDKASGETLVIVRDGNSFT